MFCIACGKSVIEGTRFCGHCGAKLFVPPASPESVDSPLVPLGPAASAVMVATPSAPPLAPPAPAPRADAAAVVPSLTPPIATPTAEPAPMLFGAVEQEEPASKPPASLFIAGGVGVLLSVSWVITGFWREPWLVAAGFLGCVVAVSGVLWRYSRVTAVLGGVVSAALITLVVSQPFGGIGQVWNVGWWRSDKATEVPQSVAFDAAKDLPQSVTSDTARGVPPSMAFDTAGLPALPAGYQYLKEAGEEIDMIPFVVPESSGSTTRHFTVYEEPNVKGRMHISIAAEGEPPTRWETSGELVTATERNALFVGSIVVSGEWLLSSEDSGNILFDSVPRRVQQGRWMPVEQSSVRGQLEKGGVDVRDQRVGIVARGQEGEAGSRGTVVVMWAMAVQVRASGERKTAFLLNEFRENVGVTTSWSYSSKGEGWVKVFAREEASASESPETRETGVTTAPMAGTEAEHREVRETPSQEAGVPPSPSAVPPDSRSGDRMTAVKWVPIPDGEFTMGCTSGDGECVDYEKPSHRVMLRRGFQMAATETTNAQYRSCVEAGACDAPSPQGIFDDSSKREHPVVNVPWEAAAGFCRWAGGRLPTEVEWEFAARGGREASRYPWGNEIAEANANFGGGGTRPVCSYPPNSFGLFDMAGNVREWCADWFDGRYYSLSLWLAPKGPASGTERAVRGGSWASRPTFLRVSYRDALIPRIAHTDLGFRCVREAKAP